MSEAKHTPTMDLVIVRRRWLRGDGKKSLLRDSNGKQCCLGFYCREKALSVGQIMGVTTPEGLPLACRRGMPELLERNEFNNDLCMRLIHANDNPRFSPDQREAKIKSLFMRIGVRVTFK